MFFISTKSISLDLLLVAYCFCDCFVVVLFVSLLVVVFSSRLSFRCCLPLCRVVSFLLSLYRIGGRAACASLVCLFSSYPSRCACARFCVVVRRWRFVVCLRFNTVGI